ERLDRQGTDHEADVFLDARAACELATFSDRRALLELMLDSAAWEPHVKAAGELALAGEPDAAALLKREIVRRATSPQMLRAIQARLVGDESYPLRAFK